MLWKPLLFTALALGTTHAVAGDLSFDTIGWPNGLTGPSSWIQLQAVAADRFQLVSIPKYKTFPSTAQVTVKPGDTLYGGERSEVAIMSDSSGAPIYETPASGTQYFAFSVILPTNWQPPEYYSGCLCSWGIGLQLHGPDVYMDSPAIAFNIMDKFSLTLDGGNLDVLGRFHNKQYVFLDGGPLNLGNWSDFVLKVTFAKDNTGSVTVWRRNAGQRAFAKVLDVASVATLQFMPSQDGATGAQNHYWKQGFYRSPSPDVTSVLAITGLARAATFRTAERAAFRTKTGPGV